MTTHPSLQPVLRRSNIAQLLEYLKTERDFFDSEAHSDAAAYARGVQYGIDAVLSMWAAAVIADKAVALDNDADPAAEFTALMDDAEAIHRRAIALLDAEIERDDIDPRPTPHLFRLMKLRHRLGDALVALPEWIEDE